VIALQNVATRFWIWQMEKQSPESQLEDVALHRGLGQAIAEGDAALAERLCEQLIGNPPSGESS
jgi:DNA-binding GntR family transcriptional regulator